MQNTFSNALSEAVSKHIPLSVTRRETLAWLTLLIMRQGTICLWRLAAHVATMARTKSVRRRFYRFFQHVELDGAMTARGTTPAKNNAIKIRVAQQCADDQHAIGIDLRSRRFQSRGADELGAMQALRS